MEIRPLAREIYAGKTFTACYRTNGYYEIRPSETGFQMDYVPFAEPTERSFDDVFFGEWLEDPIAFGAFEGDKLIGYVEGSMEGWNNRFRLSNICVLDFSERSRGVGTALMKPIERAAEDAGARMLILETQSCNENAIAFYKKNGFEIVGVSPDGEKSHRGFADKHGLQFTLIADTDKSIASAYGVWGQKKFMGREYMGILRTTFVIDGEGYIEKVFPKVNTKDHFRQIADSYGMK